MKIRTDFVTNSSSANYVFELTFETNDRTKVTLGFYDEEAPGYIELTPECENNDVTFGGKSIYSITNIAELCDLLTNSILVGLPSYFMAGGGNTHHESCEDLTFVVTGRLKYYENREELAEIIDELGGAVAESVSKKTDYLINNDLKSVSSKNKKAQELGIPIITELEFILKFDEERFEELLDEGALEDLTFAEIERERIAEFKRSCEAQGITKENLKTINITKEMCGSGDSALWVQWFESSDDMEFYGCEDVDACENEKMHELFERYQDAEDDDECDAIVEEMFNFIKSNPTLGVHDNGLAEELVPYTCIWNGSDEELKEAIEKYFNSELEDDWIGCLSKEYVIDVTGKTVSHQEVIYYGSDVASGDNDDYCDDDDEDWDDDDDD